VVRGPVLSAQTSKTGTFNPVQEVEDLADCIASG
jgi:hypothetical protein